MTVVGVQLEKTTLEGAQRQLAAAEIRHNGGDAAVSVSAECFVGRDGTTLVFSSGEMGGGEIITEYQLACSGAPVDYRVLDYVPAPEKRPRCSRLAPLSRATTTDGGLRLGMSREEVQQLLGEPDEANSGHFTFSSQAEIPMTASEKIVAYPDPHSIPSPPPSPVWYRGRSVRIDFIGDRAAAIRASQITSS
jgi:hypothetical protein